MTPSELAARLDYTLLDPTATADDIRALCDKANEYGFASVCISAYWARLAANRLGVNSTVRVCAVVSYPFGLHSASVSGLEARLAVGDGATELDIMLNLGASKSGDWKAVGDELTYIVKQARQAADSGVLLKAVLPLDQLSETERQQAAELAAKSGVDYLALDASSGMVSPDDVKLVRQVAGNLKIKANGASNLDAALALLNAAAYRLGSTAAPAIVDEARNIVK